MLYSSMINTYALKNYIFKRHLLSVEKFNIKQVIQGLVLDFGTVTLQLYHNFLINPFWFDFQEKNYRSPNSSAPPHTLRVCSESRVNRGSYCMVSGLYVSCIWSRKKPSLDFIKIIAFFLSYNLIY